jgi:hypothetical protein
MRNNRRGFVISGAAGLTAFLAPNVAEACFCRRCRRASARLTHYVVPSEILSTFHCPAWGALALPTSPLQPNTSYPFTIHGSGLYAAYVAGAVFSPLIIDYNNLSSVSWGSYNYPPVVQGTGGNPDTLTVNAAYTTSGSTPNPNGILTITVTISSPPNTCIGGTWANQLVTYS